MRLTLTRLILTPFLIPLFFLPSLFVSLFGVGEHGLYILNLATGIGIIIIYIICELTDFLDGYIARKYNCITDEGKVLDPFSDVMIHITYFLCFAFVKLMPLWAFAVIMYREFAINMVRMLAIKKGIVIPANWWGKTKTFLYAISCLCGIFYISYKRIFPNHFDAACDGGCIISKFDILLLVLFALSAVASVISFLTYLIPFIKLYKQEKP